MPLTTLIVISKNKYNSVSFNWRSVRWGGGSSFISHLSHIPSMKPTHECHRFCIRHSLCCACVACAWITTNKTKNDNFCIVLRQRMKTVAVAVIVDSVCVRCETRKLSVSVCCLRWNRNWSKSNYLVSGPHTHRSSAFRCVPCPTQRNERPARDEDGECERCERKAMKTINIMILLLCSSHFNLIQFAAARPAIYSSSKPYMPLLRFAWIKQ